jgi:predicted CoA-binding protein
MGDRQRREWVDPVLGQRGYPTLADVPFAIDVVAAGERVAATRDVSA